MGDEAKDGEAKAESKDDDDDWPEYCDPRYNMPDTLEITVRGPQGEEEIIMVDVEKASKKKPYLGGYRHRETGRTYHHASSQSDKFGLIPPRRDVEFVRNRDTQTCETKTRGAQSQREYGTQMARSDLVTDDATDRLVKSRRYFSAAQLLELQRVKTLVIQCYWRGYRARKRTWALRSRLYDRQLRDERTVEDSATESQKRRLHEIERRIHPKSVQDFGLLYNELDAWRQGELERAQANQSLSAEAKKQAIADILAKETKALQTIDRLKARAARDGRARRVQRELELMAMPKKWESGGGELHDVHTPFTVRAGELHDLYNALVSNDGGKKRQPVSARLEVLLNVKWTAQEFDCALTRDIVDLADREADLLNRGRGWESLDGLRTRLGNLFLQFVETPDFNPEATRFLKVATLRHANTVTTTSD
ncbi:hypothetical protein M885DRAFT_526877 [Pelagophyceae sp. CCMP2097]|nr:hypothetical protein M885DRAFT_526877 [Pelagophyceae sp. CCMP2097]